MIPTVPIADVSGTTMVEPEDVQPWRPIETAPLDGTLVRLLVRFDRNEIEDTTEPCVTIGSHNDGEWNFVGWCWHSDEWARGSGDLLGWLPLTLEPAQPVAPIDMVLHCPACGMQHIDASWKFGQPLTNDQITGFEPVWTNPPHRSHLCHGCGHIWRPADVATNGVAAVQTKGKADSPIVSPAARPVALKPLTDEQIEAIVQGQYSPDISPADWCRDVARAIERAHGIGAEPAKGE